MIKLSLKNTLQDSLFIDSSSEKYDNPIENIIISDTGKVWKSADPFSNQHTISMIFYYKYVSCFAIFDLITNTGANINVKLMQSGDVVKEFNLTGEAIVYGYGEGPYGIFAYGGYDAPGREWMKKFRVIWFDEVYCNHIEITVTEAPDISIGYLHLGGTWTAPVGVDKDYSSNFSTIGSDIMRNIGGISTGTINRNYRNIKFTLQMLTGQDVEYLLANHQAANPVVLSIFGDLVDTESYYGTLLGKIPDGISYVGAPHKRFTAANISLEGIR